MSSDYLRTCKAECPGKSGNTCDSHQSKRHQTDGCRHGPLLQSCVASWHFTIKIFKPYACMHIRGRLLCLRHNSTMQTSGGCRLHLCLLPGMHMHGFLCGFACCGARAAEPACASWAATMHASYQSACTQPGSCPQRVHLQVVRSHHPCAASTPAVVHGLPLLRRLLVARQLALEHCHCSGCACCCLPLSGVHRYASVYRSHNELLAVADQKRCCAHLDLLLPEM